MDFISSTVLGLIQGITEFLPVSSSGHLSLFQHFFGLVDPEQNGNLFLDVLLHLGTLIAIFVYYWKDIVALFQAFFRLIASLFSEKQRREMKRENPGGQLSPDGRMILMILVATLPLFVILPIKDKVEMLYGNTLFIGLALILTGFILFLSDRRAKGKKTAKTASMFDALLVGCGQALAVIPGLSRSGTTISVGMVRGFNRKFAVRFSFLLSIPAVLGANILSIGEAVSAGIDLKMLPAYLIGTAVAAVSGYFAIGLVNVLTNKGKFGNFAYYCWGIGAAAVVATLIFK